MRKHIYIIAVLSFLFCSVQAQEEKTADQDSAVMITNKTVDEELIIDTTLHYSQQTVSSDSINEWKNQKAFAYAKYLDSLLKIKQNEKVEVQREPPGPSWIDTFLSSSGTKVFFWILAIVFILFILYKLFLTQGVFSRTMKKDNASTATASEENITPGSDFEAMIRQAITSGNYRLAVRYHYLQTLHRLAEKNLVAMAADKTNYQYVREISNKQIQNEFAALTLSYEYVWYGEFAIGENIYRKIESGFSGLNPKI